MGMYDLCLAYHQEIHHFVCLEHLLFIVIIFVPIEFS